MYGKAATTTGVLALPATGNSRPLFIAAVSLIAVGVVIMTIAAVIARKSRSEAN